jgi:hypothetical protein
VDEESLLEYFARSLGSIDVVLIPLLGLVSFALALVIVIRGKGPTVGPALVLTALLPTLYGLLSAVSGVIVNLLEISKSPTMPPPNIYAAAWSYGLVSLYCGIALGIPGYLTAMIGASVRAFRAQK